MKSEEELREEQRVNLSIGALRLPTNERAALHTSIVLTLRGPWGGETSMRATVVVHLPDGIALMLEGDSEEHLLRLLERAEMEQPDVVAKETESTDDRPDKNQNTWDRVRALSQMEKLLLAVKADRTERALLLQDSDPRVLLSLLRNPRLTVDEVGRLAKSSNMTFQIADVILKTGQWMGNLDVRLGLIHNPKTPTAFALRILPTLPDLEVKNIARTGSSTALKQAALKRLQAKTSN
ncbi:MAG TPA: hypothetical protein VNM92_08720 [Thermoanaerobaculia bacterium]|nr:hypothetical protein [Thermoanaerobaculia bacterium]